METPSTIKALEGAIEMLTTIKNGGSYSVVEYIERLQAYEAARDEHHRLVMVDDRRRQQVRELSAQRRAS